MLKKLFEQDFETRSWSGGKQKTRKNVEPRVSHIEHFMRLLKPGQGSILAVSDLGVRCKQYAKYAFVDEAARIRGIEIRYHRTPADTIVFERVA
jgi:hypothetical protein